MTAWKDMTPKERSAHMLAAKAAKHKDGGVRGAATPADPVGLPATSRATGVVTPAVRTKKMAQTEGFGRSWTQAQRDEVLRKINTKPKP